MEMKVKLNNKKPEYQCMPECIRCSNFTDPSADGEYHYCENCRETFQEVEAHGVIVEHDTDGEVHVIVTAHEEGFDGGTEASQVAVWKGSGERNRRSQILPGSRW